MRRRSSLVVLLLLALLTAACASHARAITIDQGNQSVTISEDSNPTAFALQLAMNAPVWPKNLAGAVILGERRENDRGFMEVRKIHPASKLHDPKWMKGMRKKYRIPGDPELL